jgi:ABC-type polysaccharide/polyol phosphate export permease
VLTVAGTGLGIMLAVFGARYRDLQPATQMAAGFLFMFSPVMWRPEQLTGIEWVYQLNPLHYFIQLLRDPLMGHAPPLELWIGCTAAAAALFGLGFLVYFVSRRRLYHWI